MDASRWQRIKELFGACRELRPEERRAFLDRECAHDPEARREMERLFAADDDGFLELPPGLFAGPDDSARPAAPARIGSYVVEGLIASGGMGSVYRATQQSPRRTVAVKVMHDVLASKSAVRRFEYESEILARLGHRNIAQVIEAGTHPAHDVGGAGMPYFVMEYVPDALPITEYARRQELGVAERLRLFLQVCDAVHHGHRKGVIHRDLKPTNLLVDASGEVKVIDFGVARATDADIRLTTAHTGVGELIGTLQYMSPEQCLGDPDELDTRSDVYALGVVLYELLCGVLPYEIDRIPVFEATRIVRETEPKRPSAVDRTLRGDVETIVLKALEKDPSRRYATVAALSDDLRRHLDGDVILARPSGPVTRLWKRVRRSPVLRTGVSVTVLAAAALVLYVVFVSLPQIRHERDVARTEQEKAEIAEASARAALLEADLQREAAQVARVEAEREADLNAAINAFVEDMLSAPEVAKGGRDARVASVLDRAAERIAATYAEDPEIEAELRHTLGWTYKNLGLYPEAERELRTAAELRSRLFGPRHAATLDDRVALAQVLINQGAYADAEALLRETTTALEGLRGAEHEATLRARALLGYALDVLDRSAEAEALLRDVRTVQLRTLGAGHRDTLYTGRVLAKASMQLGRYVEAEALAREVVEESRRSLGDADVETIDHMHAHAEVLTWAGRPLDAEAVYRRVMELNRERYGPEHSQTIGAMDGLAVLLSKRGALKEAEALLREVVRVAVRTRGEEHPSTLNYMNNLGAVLARQHEMHAARAVFEEVLEIRLRVQGPEHSYTLGAMTNLAGTLAATGEPAEAEALYREILTVRERVTGRDHPHTIQVRTRLADVLLDRGELAEAEPICRDATEILRASLGAGHPRTLRSQRLLARVLEEQGRVVEAEELFAAAVATAEQSLGPEHSITVELQHAHGVCLYLLERYEEAEESLTGCYPRYVELLGEAHPHTQSCVASLVTLYEAWGDAEQAAAWRARSRAAE